MKKQLTEAEAEALDFKKLKEFAKQHGITNNSKDGLIRELKKAEHVVDDAPAAPAPAAKQSKSEVFWRMKFSHGVYVDGQVVAAGEVCDTDNEEAALIMKGAQKTVLWEKRKRYASGKTEVIERHPEEQE